MIRLSYAFTLASTKLRSKRGMLFTSIMVASLLFAVLIMMVVVFTGAEKSATEFIKKAGNNHYLVKTSPNIPYEKIDFINPPSVGDIRAIKAFEKSYYQDLQNKYKTLGLEYSKDAEVPALVPAAWAPTTLPEEQRVTINWSSPVIQALRNKKIEDYTKVATNKLSDLKLVADKYGASGYYYVDKPSLLPPFPGLRLLQDNKEDFSTSELQSGDSTPYGYYVNAIHNGSYSFTDKGLLSRYLLTTDTTNLKGIPVVVSAQEAASLFGEKAGIGKEPEAASEKRAWLKDIQTKLNQATYQSCYRNTAEQALLEKIQHDYAEMKSNENNKDYKKPSLIYDYPTKPCGDIIVKEDTRTTLEKQADAKAEDTQKKLGTYVAPSHELLTFQIVGIKYAKPYSDYSKSIDEYLKNLLAPQEDSSTLDIPIQMYDSLPKGLKADAIQQEDSAGAPVSASAYDEFATRVLEFVTVGDARAFLTNETCPMSATSCDKKFKAGPYGSNYLILDEIGNMFNRIAVIAFPVVFGLATIIIWFTVSRIMAENRRETAVYRAMGAKRRDVTTIYIVYIVLVSVRIILISLTLGILFAFFINYFYGRTLTDTAVTIFGIIDSAPTFSLFNLNSPLLLVIVASIFVISIAAGAQPLIRNVMRPPIRDIRDE
ncbi:MAG TPA: FtsX-like permease family protein [Candidatus Chromulinivoraceae bacterium]|nr:FtsX-like permease family protein [Candidatus Chromulinivoraceae bacterium]